eukprot:TRINITY_DN39349_c0_g1_i1.p1 TRINITY_DN39349_c0_g1~~TRINITY_DN39349_c0_g1_i1.p1  ORF type:complete len:105 (-),score=2.49 TRINITY_DN39349_c0_g1_i1:81-350(-)
MGFLVLALIGRVNSPDFNALRLLRGSRVPSTSERRYTRWLDVQVRRGVPEPQGHIMPQMLLNVPGRVEILTIEHSPFIRPVLRMESADV